MTASTLGDACQDLSHFPGEPPPVLPHTVTPDGDGSLRADYECPCGREWACWWDAASAGWPVREERAA